jgi:esterase/lipase
MKTRIHKNTYNSIDALEYTSKQANKLLFLQHGIYGNKEKSMNLLGVSLVKLGYHVIAIDAYKHGSRSEEPFVSKNEDQSTLETMAVVKHTSEDIVSIYQDHFQDTYPQFDIIGISMGGLMAHYITTITDAINTSVALISSPQFLEAADYTFPEEKREEYPESEAIRKDIEAMDPSTHTNKMTFNRLIMLNGKHDTTIPTGQSEQFYLDHPELNIIFKTFDTDHKISHAMHETLLDLLKD